MSLPIFQVDAFADRPFTGNPAAVCPLDAPRDAAWMQSVAAEMNLSETAFLVPRDDGAFDLRWFTPLLEVDLCGHATLAGAHVLWESGRLSPGEPARFHTRSGPLVARRRDASIEMDFPATPAHLADVPRDLEAALGVAPVIVSRSRFDLLVEAGSEREVRAARPDMARLRMLDARGVILTSRADEAEADFVSRFFGPAVGVDEDPVTGSAHCALGPYWAAKLDKAELVGYQASVRGGTVGVRLEGDRVVLSGRAVTVLRGELLA